MTNARCEGFNRKAELCQQSAFRFRSFDNYWFKLLNYCA
ncbi:MAG: transposase [Oligoflexus sp.]